MIRFWFPSTLMFLVLGCGSSEAPAETLFGQTDGGVSLDAGVPACTGKMAQPTDDTWTVVSKATERTARVHVPASYDPTKPTAVVLNFHGYTSDTTQQAILSLMNAKADTEGFVVVYPQGLNNSWNAGACCGQSAMSAVDDVAFVADLLDTVDAKLCLDRRRVFSTGMSNGGFFSHRLGCELATRIAAVAPVAGVLGVPMCEPARPVPVMHFHGTADQLVPYEGNPDLMFPPVPDTFAGWAQRDTCSGSPIETFRNSDSHCSTYRSCAGGAEVTLCTVDGGGHTWPGGTPIPTGYTTPFLSATDAMWTFFTQHPLPD